MAETVELHVMTFGEPERGLWCDDCALPSALRFTFVGQSGMRVMQLGKREYCIECDRMKVA